MRIIIEGCDGTGKTTLINFLEKKLGRGITIKTSQPQTDNPFQEYLDKMLETVINTRIFDRFRVGEHIYGPIYRGKKIPEDRDDDCSVSLLKLSKKDIYIICSTTDERIERVFKERGEEFAKVEDIKKINKGFIDFYRRFRAWSNMLLYDFTKDGQDLEKYYKDFILPLLNGS